MFPELNITNDEGAGNVGDEADTSCAENKASTGTQCFESEFPDDSDIEISYSQEDLETFAAGDECHRFKPIQSSSEELGAEPIQGWRSQGQFSVESDPNGYDLDLGIVSPPSDIEENSLGSLGKEVHPEASEGLQQGNLYSSIKFGFHFTITLLLTVFQGTAHVSCFLISYYLQEHCG